MSTISITSGYRRSLKASCFFIVSDIALRDGTVSLHFWYRYGMYLKPVSLPLGLLDNWDVPLPDKILSLKPREIQEMQLENGNHVKFESQGIATEFLVKKSDESGSNESQQGRFLKFVLIGLIYPIICFFFILYTSLFSL
jgi:hypothetical protein